jgi:hypothetical protein
MRRLLLLATAAVLLPACGVFDDDDNDAPAAPADGTALLEVVHASSNAPNVNLILNGTPLRAGTDVPFKAALAARVTPDENSLEVEAIIPGGNSVVIGPADLPTPDDTRVTVFAANLVADIEPIVLSAPEAELGAGEARVRVLHAAPTVTPVAAMVDIYVTAPDADLAAEAPLTTLMFGEASAEPGAVVPAGDYRIRVTPAGDDTVVFDSGTVAVAEGADLIVAAVDSTVPGDAPISLLVLDGTGALEILDSETPSTVRVVHASPDAPNVDVLVDDATPPAIVDLAFGDATDRIPLPPAEYNFKVVPTGEAAPVVIDEDLGLVAGVEYSVFAAGLLADLGSMEDDALPIGALVLTDDDRSVGTEAKLRVVHTSPAAGNVDIYLVEQGADIADIDPTLADVPFLANSGYLSVPPGPYDVIVTGAGSKMPAIGPAPVTLDAGGVYTAAARDADGGGAPLSLILLDDFANQ